MRHRMSRDPPACGAQPARIAAATRATTQIRAAAKGLTSYGVLVMRDDASNDFLVITRRDSPELQFTAATCR